MRLMQQTTLKLKRRTVIMTLCVLWLTLSMLAPVQAATLQVGGLAQAAMPTHLIIPSLNMDAPIESVGKDANGAMQAPSNDIDVAWYNLGPRPGDKGNAVIAGHLDDVQGKPAIFWYIDTLKAGDKISVRFGNGQEKHFAVTSVESYDADDAPMDLIFGVDINHDLNLITCGGVWNAKSKLYSKRLVVYARLINESNNPAQSNPTSPLPVPPSPRPTHAWQNSTQPSATS